MDVLLQMPASNAEAWHRALRAALPEARIFLWPDAPAAVDFALVWRPPEDLFERLAVRRAIVNLGAGVDALMRARSLPCVPILRLEDAGMAEQMREYVAAAVLGAYRELDAYAAQQREARWAPRDRLDKSGFGVGIMGFGVLGRAVADALAPFGFPLASWSRSRHGVPGVRSFTGAEELARFLERTQVLVCMLPSTPATRGLLDRATLSRLPRGAHLVNVARGALVLEPDLVALLDEGHLASATLDVFAEEPLPADHPFWHHPRVRLTPHVSAVTLVDESVGQAVAKMRALVRGESVSGIVDRALGY